MFLAGMLSKLVESMFHVALQNMARGSLGTVQEGMQRAQRDLGSVNYRDVDNRYSTQLLEVKTNEMGISDLEKYHKVHRGTSGHTPSLMRNQQQSLAGVPMEKNLQAFVLAVVFNTTFACYAQGQGRFRPAVWVCRQRRRRCWLSTPTRWRTSTSMSRTFGRGRTATRTLTTSRSRRMRTAPAPTTTGS